MSEATCSDSHMSLWCPQGKGLFNIPRIFFEILTYIYIYIYIIPRIFFEIFEYIYIYLFIYLYIFVHRNSKLTQIVYYISKTLSTYFAFPNNPTSGSTVTYRFSILHVKCKRQAGFYLLQILHS